MFASRNSRKVRVDGNLDRYEFLHILPFDNTRKRMSIILRDPSGKVSVTATSKRDQYLTRDYYDRYKVAGFGKFRHIFPEPHFPWSYKYPPIIIPSWRIEVEIDKIVTGKMCGFQANSPSFYRTILSPVVNKPAVIIPSKVAKISPFASR